MWPTLCFVTQGVFVALAVSTEHTSPSTTALMKRRKRREENQGEFNLSLSLSTRELTLTSYQNMRSSSYVSRCGRNCEQWNFSLAAKAMMNNSVSNCEDSVSVCHKLSTDVKPRTLAEPVNGANSDVTKLPYCDDNITTLKSTSGAFRYQYA
ncbi:hypothetical protein F2P81_000463 [Scophthalmus maximus]|uniref:Secreted protein n=1 Tax=Scophthalmus maximus TaxID=52904 RepID=A0A6A4TT89_SCOMX|nr:hypothetical protein F2P81_000463 [Scophthalmus maximus]